MARLFAILFTLCVTLFALSIPALAQEALPAQNTLINDDLAGCDFMGTSVEADVRNYLADVGHPVSMYLPDDSGSRRIWYWIDPSGQRIDEREAVRLPVALLTGRVADAEFEYEANGAYAVGRSMNSLHNPNIDFIQIYDHTAREDKDWPLGYHPCFSMAFEVEMPGVEDTANSDFPPYEKCLRLSIYRDPEYAIDVNGFCTPGGEMYTGPYLKPWMIQPND